MSTQTEAVSAAGATIRLAITELVNTSSKIQALICSNITENYIAVMDGEMFLKMHQQLQPIQNAAGQLIELLKSEDILTKKIDTNSCMNVDDLAWAEAKSLIQKKGFVRYLEDLQVRNSRLDRIIDNTAKQLAAWLILRRENQVSSISRNDGIAPAVATLGTSVTLLHSYATAGMLLVQQLTKEADERIDA